jgi:protein tyrosine/serine phosphatase
MIFKGLFGWWKLLEASLDDVFGKDISTKGGRWRAVFHYYLVDHGALRIGWYNLHEIAAGVWRSNQPSKGRLKRYKAMGIKSVLNLRGETDRSPYLFEDEACSELGMEFMSVKLSARKLARRSRLLTLLDTFETFERPFVLHCKSGADRAGLASVLYLLHIEGLPLEQARKQLSLKYLHFRNSKTGILDYFLDAYSAESMKDPMPIRRWLEVCYDRNKLTKAFRSNAREI